MKELVPRYSLRLVREHADDWTRDLQTSPQDIVRFFRDRLYDSPNEEVVMLMMATNNTIIGSALVSRGTIGMSFMCPAVIARHALVGNASSVIVAHNHPSGNLEPSPEDIASSKAVKAALALFNIPLHDSIIIGADGYTSLAERGAL